MSTQIKGFGAETKGIRGIYNPTDEQRKTLAYVYSERFIAMRDSKDRQDSEKNWDRWEKQWEGYRVPQRESGQEEWMSNHVVPMTLSIVETALAEMTRQNFRPMVLPWGREDVPKAKVMEHIWDFIWSISGGDLTMYGIIKDLLMYGTAIGQEYYLKDRRMVKESKIDLKGRETTKEKEIFDYDDCMLEQVKLQDFYVDEFARGFSGPYAARDCIRRYIMNIDDFHVMYDGSQWDQFGNAKFVKEGGNTDYYEFFQPPTGWTDTKKVEVLHYWSIKPNDRFVIVANDVVVRDGANPYKHKQLPFARAVDVKRPHRFYAKGQPEILESVQNEADTLRRMIIDRNHLDIDKMFFVSNRLGLSDEDLIARPHGMIPTDDVNSAKAVEYGDIPRSVEMSLDKLGEDSVIATGIDPRSQSLPQAGTATEASMLKDATLRRITMKLWLMRKEFLPRIGMLRASNVIQFYSQPKLEDIIGKAGTEQYKEECARLQQAGLLDTDEEGNKKKISYRSIPIKGKKLSMGAGGQLGEEKAKGYSFFELKPDYFIPERGGYWFKFESGENLDESKPLQQQKDLEMFDRFSKIALEVPNSYDIMKLGDMILEDYGKNPDDFKPDQQGGQSDEDQQLQQLLDLAHMENQQMMQGQQVPPTAYSNNGHTLVHITFMKGKQFQALDNSSPIIKEFTKHVTGEIMAQQGRQQSGVTPGSSSQPDQSQQQDSHQQPPEPPKVSVSIKADAATQAGQELLKDTGILPPDQSPTGDAGQGGASNGTTNQEGGMAQPSTAIADVMPSLNVGGNMQKK